MRLSALACKCGIWECLFLCVSSCLSGCQSACVWPRGCGPSSPFTNNIYAVYGCYWLETTGLKLKLLHQRPQPNGAAEATKIGSYCSPRCRAPQRRKGPQTPSPSLPSSRCLTLPHSKRTRLRRNDETSLAAGRCSWEEKRKKIEIYIYAAHKFRLFGSCYVCISVYSAYVCLFGLWNMHVTVC